MLKLIDLNVINTEEDLEKVIKTLLRSDSTILLRNYANIKALQALSNLLAKESPDTEVGLDQNFSGCTTLDGGISVEQYIGKAQSIESRSTALGKLNSRLLKIALFFAKVCLSAVGQSELSTSLDEIHSVFKVTRYHKSISKSVLDLEFDYEDEYVLHTSPGVITVFPIACGIRYKQHGKWEPLNEPDCILIQTGTILSRFSNGTHTVDPIKISTSNTAHLTIFPSMDASINGESVSDVLLADQLQQFPQAAKVLYPRQYAIDSLNKKVECCKEIFYVTDSVISLYSISRSIMTSALELHRVLPQISNMLKRKISQDDFLRMMSLWNEAYVLEVNSSFEITIQIPSRNLTNTLSGKSRKLQYSEYADQWLSDALQKPEVPPEVPVLSIKKRRGSEDTFGPRIDSRGPDASRSLAQPKRNRTRGYIANTKEKFMFKVESESNDGTSLLERIKQKEKKVVALLSQRERNYQQYLNVKTYQVFDILQSLAPDKPYTITHLTSLIVDSLIDSNNPVGENETHDILSRLQSLLNDQIRIIEVEGCLKVFRWVSLDRQALEDRINKSNNEVND